MWGHFKPEGPCVLRVGLFNADFLIICCFYRGNIDRALELYEKAVSYARTDLEMAHLFSLYEAAAAQKEVAKELNVPLQNLIPGLG